MMKKKKLSNRYPRFVYMLITLPMMLGAMSGTRALASHPGVITETIYYPVTPFMGACCVSPQSDVPPPTFVGGKQAMNKYLSDHVKYPEDARKAGISGVVLVQFDVTSDGSVDNVSVSRSLYPSLDKEALRVISAMPKWNNECIPPVIFRMSWGVPFGGHEGVELSVVSSKVDDSSCFDCDVIETSAEYPGGLDALWNFLKSNMIYPEDAKAAHIEGRVLTVFEIDEYGKISNSRVLRSVHPSLDAEAMRLIHLMPIWEPGTLNNKPVRVHYNIPVTFRLPSCLEDKKQSSEADGYEAVVDDADKNPDYPDGIGALMDMIDESLVYPKVIETNRVQGVVLTSFIVEKDGSVSNIKVVRGVHPDLDAEAIRVLGLMAKWSPAQKNGHPVRFRVNLPISFRLK